MLHSRLKNKLTLLSVYGSIDLDKDYSIWHTKRGYIVTKGSEEIICEVSLKDALAELLNLEVILVLDEIGPDCALSCYDD